MPKNISLGLTPVIVTLILFVFSLINLLRVAFILLYVLGLAYFVYLIYKRKIPHDINISNIVFTILLALTVLISLNVHLIHYDNFSHWAVIVKHLNTTGLLPTASSIVTYPNYPPGSALFISFFCFFTSSTENFMIIGQNILTLLVLKNIFVLIECPSKIIKWIIAVIFYLFNICILTSFNDLLVDSILAFYSLFLFLVINKYQGKSYKYLLVLCGYLYLLKNASLVFIIFGIVYYYAITKDWKKILKTILYLILLIVGWNISGYIRYGDNFFNSRHQVSFGFFVKMFFSKGFKRSLNLFGKFLLQIVNFKRWWIDIFYILFNLLLIPFIFFENNKKEYLKKVGIYNGVYLIYYLFLGFMYVFSMPYHDAIEFSSFDRYIGIILVVFLGLIIYFLLQNKNYKLIIAPLIFFMIIPVFVNSRNSAVLIGIDGYKGSQIEKMDIAISSDIDLKKSFLIYSPDSENDSDFLYYLSKYKLNNKNIALRYKIGHFDTDYVIVLDHNLDVVGTLSTNYQKVNKYLYMKSS